MAKITKTQSGLKVPENPVVPFICGDGIGKEIMPVCQDVVNIAVKRMYSGGYPFSVPVIPVHFLGVKTDYLLRS